MPAIKSRKYIQAFVVIFMACFVGACSTMTPPRYSLNADTNVMLRKMQGTSVAVVSLKNESEFSANCRLMGPIEASDNRSIGQFIRDSFNDEFKFAGIYGGEDSSNRLEVVLKKVDFSSMDNLTEGRWDLEITLSNVTTGESLHTSTRYVFESGFDAMTACNQTADALTPAVQELIKSAVSHKSFKSIVGQT